MLLYIYMIIDVSSTCSNYLKHCTCISMHYCEFCYKSTILSYLTGCPFQDVSVVSNPNFFWLVDCAMDTTVKHTYCAYDR